MKDGCAFVGWFTQPDGGQQITANSTTGASNITLYAHYQGQYTYQFVNYDGSVYAQGKLTAGQTIPRPAGTPTRPADSQYTYTFTGWQGYTNGMTISGNVTFAAQYAAKAVESVPKEITTGAYRIADSYLRAIPMGTTARQLLANLSPSDYITLPVQGDSLVGTGMTVTYARDGQTIQTLTTVVTGDLSGDGRVTITDMVRLQAHLLGKTPLTGAALQAADLNGDGQVTITDMVRLQAYLLGRVPYNPTEYEGPRHAKEYLICPGGLSGSTAAVVSAAGDSGGRRGQLLRLRIRDTLGIHGDGLHHLGLFGLVGHHVAGLIGDAVHHVHAVHDAAEGGVLPIQMGGVLVHDEELAAGRVHGLCAGHAEDAAGVAKVVADAVGGELALDAVAGAAHAGAVRAAALDHKAFDDAVEDQSVIVAFLDQADKIVYRIWCDLRIELCLHDIAIFHLDSNDWV